MLALGLLTAALVYLGFALFRGGPVWIVAELLGVGTYGLLAWMGLRRSPLWLAGGWALHPVWDVGVHLIATEGSPAPAWYIIACISFDLLVAGGVAMRFRLTPEGST